MSPLFLSLAELDLAHALDQLGKLTSCRADIAAASALAALHSVHIKECLLIIVFHRIRQVLGDKSLGTYLHAAGAVDAC